MQTFAALADETRLAIVHELTKGERSVNEIVSHFGLRQPTISQHLKVLRAAGLVRVRPDAQRRLYTLDPSGFRVIELWLERHRRAWARQLDQLEELMDEQETASNGAHSTDQT